MVLQIARAKTDTDFRIVARMVQDMGRWDLAMTRTRTEADLSELAAFYSETLDTLRHTNQTDRAAILLARDGDTALGCLGYKPFAPRTAELCKFWVDPAARGKGVGQSLIVHLVAALPECGYGEACLETSTFMSAAIALYLAHGFTHCPPFRPPLACLGDMDVFMHRAL